MAGARAMAGRLGSLAGEQLAEVRFDGEARGAGVQRSVGIDLGGIEVQLLAPDQPDRPTLLHDRLEEAAEDS